MSASREKKQRQGVGPSEKTLQAHQQQAARKRKTIIYTAVGVVIAALVAALLIWNSGFFQARAVVATVNGTNISAAEMDYYYYDTRTEEFYYYSVLGLNVPKDSDTMDSSTGRTYRDYFLEKALSNAQKDMALADEARKNGHTEAEVKDSLNASIKRLKTEAAMYGTSYVSYLRMMYGGYMTAGIYEKLSARSLLADLAYSEKSTGLVDSYSEADLRAYYDTDDNADTLDTFEYSYLYFVPDEVKKEDEDGNALDEDAVAELEEAAMAEAKANAEEALASLRDGGSISSLAEKYELSESRYGDHVSVVGISAAPSAIRDEMLSMKDGDMKLVENGEIGFYVVAFHSRKLVEDPTKDVRHILARAETTTDEDGKLLSPTTEAWAAARERIEAIQAEYEAGARTEDSFAALANEKSDDGDGTTGGLYTKINIDDSYVPEFLDWIFADGRKAGDTGIIQHDAGLSSTNGYWGYHFMYLVGDNEPVWMRGVRSILANEAITAWMEELTDSYEAAFTGSTENVGR